MSRTYLTVPFTGSMEQTDEAVREILIQSGYKEIPYNLEVVWKMGTGLATAMHFIKVEYKDAGTLVLAGWVQMGVGSAGGKEHALDGMVGAIPKKSVKKTMERIAAAVSEGSGYAPLPEPGNAGNQAAVISPPGENTFCPQCGSRQPQGARFCGQCGTRLMF